MNIPEHLKFTTRGFSGKRVGYILSLVSFALVPSHFYISCQTSGAVAGIAFVIFGVTIIFSLVNPQGTPHRLHPVALAFIALAGHTLCSH
ncbi:MAG: hypothetical protein ACTHLW_01015 [Verrucomicrobiota bacterium]